MKKLSPSGELDQIPRRKFLGGLAGAATLTPLVGSAFGDSTDEVDGKAILARRPSPPYRVWFQPGLFHRDIDRYEHMTIDLVIVEGYRTWRPLSPRHSRPVGKAACDVAT